MAREINRFYPITTWDNLAWPLSESEIINDYCGNGKTAP